LLGNFFVVAVLSIGRLGREPMAERIGDLLFERFGSNPWLDATKSVEPVRFGYLQNCRFALEHGLGIQRNPEGGRTLTDAVAEESGRSDADDRHRMALDVDR